VGKAVPDLQHN